MTNDTTGNAQHHDGHGDGNVTIAVLEHLTGPSRGTVTWLSNSGLDVLLDKANRLQVEERQPDASSDSGVAQLWRADGSFEIEAAPGSKIWVNGRLVERKILANHDMIEFGNSGPMSRFCICTDRQPIQNSFPGIIRDSLAYLRSSRKSLVQRIARSVYLAVSRGLFETSYFFRISVLAALLVLGFVVYQQARVNALLSQRLARSDIMLEQFSRTVSRNRENAVTPAELEGLRRELGTRVETAAGRLDELELRSKAGAQIIRQYSASVVMVQSAYGFRHTPTGRFLRQVLGEDGRPQMAANGLIMLSLDGTGAIAERQFIGTAFAVKGEGLFVTNRHVGYPWEQDAIIALRSDSGLEPVLLKLVAFIPGRKQAATVEVVAASQQDDLALLRLSQNGLAVDGPALADEVAQPGEEVIVLGYPTGLRSLLAQAGDEFIKTIQQSETTEFWNVARSLAEADKIAPLASRGIVGRVSEHNIVYDAETTHGGSGGPVFNIKGQVIAVNTAILPEFGGANLGIPAAKIQMLIDEAKN